MAFKRSVFLFLLVVSSAFLGVEIARGAGLFFAN